MTLRTTLRDFAPYVPLARVALALVGQVVGIDALRHLATQPPPAPRVPHLGRLVWLCAVVTVLALSGCGIRMRYELTAAGNGRGVQEAMLLVTTSRAPAAASDVRPPARTHEPAQNDVAMSSVHHACEAPSLASTRGM